jgi:iron complex transport system ATP-binding protein
MLVAEHVSFAYDDKPIVDDVTLTVERGSVVAVLGPNGAGKTTLLRMLAGIIPPAGGSLTLDGQPLQDFSRKAIARRIAVVPQETHPAFAYTAMEIVLMGRYAWLGAFELEGPNDVAAASDALAATGTGHLAKRSFASLSGGEKQRVVIASALAQLDARGGHDTSAAILMLDEPTTALDLRYQLEVASLMSRLHTDRGVTMVLSTHDLRLASSTCSHAILLSSGRVVGTGRTAEILTPDRLGALYSVAPHQIAPYLA